jgi:phosphate transport system substrate-binding protein
MNSRSTALFAALAALALGAAGCGGPEDDVTLQGSGATFPAPLYKRWYLEYYKQHPEVRVNYTPIGSGAGIRQFTAKLTNFGASDAGMSKKEIEGLPEEFGPPGAAPQDRVRLLPMTAGSIVLSYHLPGVSQPIRLSRSAYLGIFLGVISTWDDDEIARENPGVKLPGQNIIVVTRADSSGTTDVFTNHLFKVSQDPRLHDRAWNKDSAVGKAPKWPGPTISAQGNDGVAALIQLTPGAIGYLEFGYANLAGLPMAELQNHEQEFVAPDNAAGRKALELSKDAEIPKDLQVKNYDPKQKGAYPIVTYTWVLCRKRYPADQENAVEKMKAVLRFCLEDARQEIAEQLGYIRLPKAIVEKTRAAIEEIEAAP